MPARASKRAMTPPPPVWRIGQAALREFKSLWGRRELEVVCYVPPQTPFTCLVDGLSVGTGNSLGRLDLRLAEALTYQEAFVAVGRKDGKGQVLEFRPHPEYLESILNQPVEKLEALCHECSRMPEEKLFSVRRVGRGEKDSAQANAGPAGVPDARTRRLPK